MLLANPPRPLQAGSNVTRPIANFQPSVWGDHFLNYTPTDEEVAALRKQEHESLKFEVTKELLRTMDKPLENLELIDTMERLGLAYHFEKEIEDSLEQIFETYYKENHANQENKLDLYHASLRFRILRQHGYFVSSDVFTKFTNEDGNFLETLKTDARGLLSLYDAAYLRGNGEAILDNAIKFTTIHLKVIASQKDHPLAPQIARALVYPTHKGVTRIESLHYMSYYERDPSHIRSLLRFSKLEFDVLQSLHKKELQELTKWWRRFDFPRAFPFIRDRLVEAYFFSVAIFHDPKFSTARIFYTKAFMLLSIMDDIYDSYGTIEELEAFTKAIGRWEKRSIDELPSYMKLFYVIQHDTYKQMEHEMAKQGMKGYVQYVIQEVITLSKAYLQEARWQKMKYVPTFDEYFDNAVTSIATTVMVYVSMLFNEVEESVCKKAFESVSMRCKAQRATSIIGRFVNDLADHKWDKHRDHVAGGVDCYIKQYNVSEDDAYVAIDLIVEDAWKDLNEEIFRPVTPVLRPLLAYICDFCRVVDYVYKNENGFTNVSQRMRDTIELLFIEPLSF